MEVNIELFDKANVANMGMFGNLVGAPVLFVNLVTNESKAGSVVECDLVSGIRVEGDDGEVLLDYHSTEPLNETSEYEKFVYMGIFAHIAHLCNVGLIDTVELDQFTSIMDSAGEWFNHIALHAEAAALEMIVDNTEDTDTLTFIKNYVTEEIEKRNEELN